MFGFLELLSLLRCRKKSSFKHYKTVLFNSSQTIDLKSRHLNLHLPFPHSAQNPQSMWAYFTFTTLYLFSGLPEATGFCGCRFLWKRGMRTQQSRKRRDANDEKRRFWAGALQRMEVSKGSESRVWCPFFSCTILNFCHFFPIGLLSNTNFLQC